MISREKKIITQQQGLKMVHWNPINTSPKIRTNPNEFEKYEQARADLARLAIVRKQREEASKKCKNDLDFALKNKDAKSKLSGVISKKSKVDK